MVSVIVPTCNRPERLRAALESVNRQQYQDFEVIVVNDGTFPVESVVTEMNLAGRITLVNHDRNRGLAAARNTGLREAGHTQGVAGLSSATLLPWIQELLGARSSADPVRVADLLEYELLPRLTEATATA